MSGWLVAREAKKMAPVVDKLVNHAAMYQGSGSLFRSDEIDQKQHQQTAE
jgi:hypothetical protein